MKDNGIPCRTKGCFKIFFLSGMVFPFVLRSERYFGNFGNEVCGMQDDMRQAYYEDMYGCCIWCFIRQEQIKLALFFGQSVYLG